MPEKTLADEKATFWALVTGRNNPEDAHLYMEGVEVVEAGLLGQESVCTLPENRKRTAEP